jgi:hypothetical protein
MVYTNIEHSGPISYGQFPDTIGVWPFPDAPQSIGKAHCVGWTDRRFALWKLAIHGEWIPGRWVILNRQFIEIQ